MDKFWFWQDSSAESETSLITDHSVSQAAKPAWTLQLAVGGFGAALFGVYWDDAWHTDRGRDDLLSLPHIVLYLGVLVTMAVVLRWAWLDRAADELSSTSGANKLALLGAGVTVGSAPVDEWWHSSFGRDAVLWSPPHLVALVGTIALGTGVVVVAACGIRTKLPQFGITSCVAAGAGLIGGWQVLVLEYDTDVPQFSAIWYLPILAAGASLAALTIQAAFADSVRWPAMRSSVVYTVAMVAVIATLWSLEFSTPIVPFIVPAMFAADVSRERGVGLVGRTFSLVIVMFAAYVPYLYIFPGAVSPSFTDVAGGVPLALFAVAATIVLFEPRPSERGLSVVLPVAASILVAITFVVSTASQAVAHDPGQGFEISEVYISVSTVGQRISITATPSSGLAGPEPVRALARRAGRTIEGTLEAVGSTWFGELEVDDDGRWFVYIVAQTGIDQIEAWVPIIVGTDRSAAKQTAFYRLDLENETSTAQVAGGVILVALAALVVGGISREVRSLAEGER